MICSRNYFLILELCRLWKNSEQPKNRIWMPFIRFTKRVYIKYFFHFSITAAFFNGLTTVNCIICYVKDEREEDYNSMMIVGCLKIFQLYKNLNVRTSFKIWLLKHNQMLTFSIMTSFAFH